MVVTPPTVRRVRGWWLWAQRVLVVVALLCVAGNITCWWAGLGDPPLYITDPEIGYMMKPGVSHPFGHTVTINRWSQRGADLSERKGAPNERRVLVIGDSIVYGGSLQDDADLATVMLEPLLARAWGGTVRIANIACGSWGPGNQLAYLRRLGTFDADAAVIVLNSLDYGSVVRHEPLSWGQPTRKPIIALEEGVQRFILRFAPALSPGPSSAIDEYNPTPQDAEGSLRALREMVELLRARGVRVAAVMHPRQSELEGAMLGGRARLMDALGALNVPVLTTDEAMRASLSRGEGPYRDDIHLTTHGQRVLSEVLLAAVRAAMPVEGSR